MPVTNPAHFTEGEVMKTITEILNEMEKRCEGDPEKPKLIRALDLAVKRLELLHRNNISDVLALEGVIEIKIILNEGE